ncbi:MAG: hypothetical protein DMF95_27630 [Acidobacteria bacterium]|nr:MAG: hypothetical protein DMF95_27630 [Acidobacteriota bacterium]
MLERWRESGVAPDRIDASHVTNNRVDMTRPLCPYAQVAQYTGVGSTNDAENFVSKTPWLSESGHDAPTLSVSAGCAVHGRRQYPRRREFRLQDAIGQRRT